ncbi:FMN-binding glutamate synthase family protein [Fluoribacter dumoffii]|uniref:Ferredoxin-dependent glutamate synthase 1 n=1 Tax=Fluoribacter dumoffii TaxID=463 RepID=A0A377GA67_9GAMM|nr:FMN-binding glutamate synthase family protein [Fluoribacter dumoffii]KTC90141.1 glutamate synthase [Fluoribacter dumoffii NY 23]MCW8385436.1 FMN-binding glutamate synthase family protein [Fluoribacter dumoffii]MCW8418489.1 FMN-binding glutamate synthase family protein [Fluoribacter dumoffii]MCW8453669.1 FMN-binding glutamate synthase family protein [Fluoribacter dumoffii]MCW8459113.1 FMN-binding glutamate synthase family protein [Fluoribacter dumoffii]
MKENYFHSLSLIEVLFVIIFVLAFIITLWNILQKEHTILRNFPLIGYVRYFAEFLGVYLRQYFYARDREELPFNRTERTWIYEASKNIDTTIGFGSTRDRRPVNTIYFVDSPFPVIKRDVVKAHAVTIGQHCRHPYTTNSLINISAMSHGSISPNAILALSYGAKKAGCWLNTGEGGLSSYHLAGECDVVAQIGTAKYGYQDEYGNLSDEKLKKAAAHPQVKMFEIKLSQGAKPGKGGLLPGVKVTKEIAEIRGIKPYKDSVSPNRFPEISNSFELLNLIHHIREITGKPTGFKIVLGNYEWLDELCQEILKRGVEYAPDFITLDGAEGGTGAAPLTLADYMGLPLTESLPVLVDKLIEYDLRERIKIIASGKLITPGRVAWALCVGADFVNSARGFMFALGCVQALKCHKNTCPTGITTHNKWLVRGLNPKNKADRVYYYVKNLSYEVGVICHSCGVKEPRELRRHHARIVSEHGTSVSLADVYPPKKKGSKVNINKEKN